LEWGRINKKLEKKLLLEFSLDFGSKVNIFFILLLKMRVACVIMYFVIYSGVRVRVIFGAPALRKRNTYEGKT